MNGKIIKIKEILTSVTFAGILAVLFIVSAAVPAPEILETERRYAAQFPQLRAEDILAGTFAAKFEKWAQDGFAFRDGFRTMNSFLIYEIYRQNDKAGIYRSDEAGTGELRPVNTGTVEEAARKIINISNIFDGYDMKFYFSVIPDKSSYTGKFYPGFDATAAAGVLSTSLVNFKYIDITETLDAGSYYKTDLHWNQATLAETAEKLLLHMKPDSGRYDNGVEILQAGEFKGIYAGEYAAGTGSDILTYASMPELRVSYLDAQVLEVRQGDMYDISRLAGIDPYDFFLQGPQPLVIIENKNAPGQELIVFRDSFGSSLMPLLSPAYSRITLIDLRYIHIAMIEKYIDFAHGSDVLFIYSSLILGNPGALQG